MRFRARFRWLQNGNAVLWLGLSYAWWHKATADPAIRSAYLIAGVIWSIFGVLNLVGYVLTWWDVGDDCLTRRQFWTVRRVPWREITRIAPGRQPKSVEVEYSRPAPLSDRGTFIIQPSERDALVRTLRLHAPQADFEPFPIES